MVQVGDGFMGNKRTSDYWARKRYRMMAKRSVQAMFLYLLLWEFGFYLFLFIIVGMASLIILRRIEHWRLFD